MTKRIRKQDGVGLSCSHTWQEKTVYLLNQFIEMSTFIAVVEAQGISIAAQRLGTSKSVVSARVQQLEKRLGTVLLERGRPLQVTEAGQAFYERVVKIMADVSEAEATVASLQASLQGTLKLAVSMVFAIAHLDQILARFMAQHPQLILDIHTTDQYVNLHDEQFDAAIRIGPLNDSSLIARLIAPNTRVICASKDYLQQYGTPIVPQDLQRHTGVFYSNREKNSSIWHLPVDGQVSAFRIGMRLRTDNGFQLLQAAKAGLGLAILPTFLAYEALADRQLQIVLPAYAPTGSQIALVYRQSKRTSPKIQALYEFLRQEINNPPYWDQHIQHLL